MSRLDVHIHASSSKGNAITVSDGVSTILLDAGLSYNQLARKVNMNDVEAVLITHEHADHSKAVPELMRRGIDVYISKGTFEAINPDSPTAILCRHGIQRETANWYVLPFDLDHDAKEPLGFLLQSKNSGKKCLYIVDSAIVEYDFTGVNTFIIEANYAEDIIANGDQKEWLKNRIRTSHFSLQNLKDFLGSSDLSQTEEIFLVHLSDSNSNEERFRREIMELTGVPVFTDSDFTPLKPVPIQRVSPSR